MSEIPEELIEGTAQKLWNEARARMGSAPSKLPKSRTDFRQMAKLRLQGR